MTLNQLDREQKIKLHKLLSEKRRRQCEASYYEFFLDAWHVLEPGQKLNNAPFIKYLCDRIQHHVECLISDRPMEIDMLIINIPPGMSKSSMVSKFLNAWIWIRAPHLNIFNSSYAQPLSQALAMKSRDLMKSHWYTSRWGDAFKLKSDQNTKSRFHNDKTGERIATSKDGTITGFHCALWIDDDPMNPQQAASETKLASAINYNDRTVPSRLLVEKSFRIMVMQRLHVDDPSGHELRKEEKRIEHICLPASISDNVRPLEARALYDHQGLLNPKRFGYKELAKFKEDLGSYGYAGQYDQSPFPEGGGKIKSDWFEYCTLAEVPGQIIWNVDVDGAYTKSTQNDPTGLWVSGYWEPTKTMYVKHAYSARLELPEFIKFLTQYCELHQLGSKSKVYFEPKASGKSMKQTARAATNLSAVEIKSSLVSEGKEARCQAAAPKFEASRVVFVKGRWNEEVEAQLTQYPNAKHDEYIDLAGYSCERYFDKKKRKGVSLR